MEEKKSCLKSKAELNEIRKARAAKKSEVNEISDETANKVKIQRQGNYAKAAREFKKMAKENPGVFQSDDQVNKWNKATLRMGQEYEKKERNKELNRVRRLREMNKPIKESKINENLSKDELADIKDIIGWLLTHNKNYTKTQYYKLFDLEELINKIQISENLNTKIGESSIKESFAANEALELSKKYLGEIWASTLSGMVEIDIPREIVNKIAQSGDNLPAVQEALKNPDIAKQFADYNDEEIDKAFDEVGMDMTDEEIKALTRKDKEAYILWDLAWDIFDGAFDESAPYIKKITKKEWDETPADYKMIKNGEKYLMYVDDDTRRLVLGKVEIVNENP